jgi:phosphoglycolate phosphatase-like HAD superfamily hydrolase
LTAPAPIRAVLYDFDGTLADSTELTMRCYRHTMRTHLGEVLPDEVWLSGFGTTLEAQIARFASLRDVERWVAAGVPVVVSYRGASNGHLAVIVGFDGSGDPVVNDPAGRRDEDVRRTYERAWLEHRWLEHSGGTVYLIHPPRHPVPPLG